MKLPGRHRLDREILTLAVPALATLIAEPLYVLADTAVVGRIGTDELAGMALAVTVVLTAFALFIFLAYGTTAAVSRLLGAGEEREAARQAIQGMWLAIAVGIGLSALGLLFGPALLRAIGGQGIVLDHALTYFRISLIGFPFLLVSLAGTGYLRGLKDTRTPMAVSIGSALFNLVLEVILIFGLDFGLGASALSTALAQILAAAVYVERVRRSVARFNISLRPDPASMRRLLVVGRDLLIRTAALRGSFTIATAVAARIGVPELASHQIANEIWMTLALALDALAIAAQAMIGTALGAGQREQAHDIGRRVVEWGFMGGVGLGALLVGLRGPLAQIFTNDPEVIRITGFILLFVGVMQPVNGIVFALDGILIGAGDMSFLARAMAIAAVPGIAAIVIPLVFDLGIGWLWTGLVIFMIARAATLLWRFRTPAWLRTGAV